MSTTIVTLALAGIVLLAIIGIYNNLIKHKNGVKNAFGGMDTQLKQRYDLIPNLVASVKEYTSHERSTLQSITELRSKGTNRDITSTDRVAIDQQVSSKLSELMVNVENYPDLKASANFIQLQRSLNEVEAQISAARRTYNAMVTSYNNAIQMFPSNIMANMMGLKEEAVFEIEQIERERVEVNKLFKK